MNYDHTLVSDGMDGMDGITIYACRECGAEIIEETPEDEAP